MSQAPRVEDGETGCVNVTTLGGMSGLDADVFSICVSSDGVSAAFSFGESTSSFSILHINDSGFSVGPAKHGGESLMLSDALVVSSTSSWDGGTAVEEGDSRATELDSVSGSSVFELGGKRTWFLR